MFKQVMKYRKNVRFVNFIRVCQRSFVQFTLDFFKGSVILRSTHVCKECWVITFETWKTPYICNWEIPRWNVITQEP